MGSAKLFIQSQSGLNTYQKIKTSLIEEFGKKINQAQLHRELQNRKMRSNETVFEYLIAIRELANRAQGFIDESSIIDYCINGINDSTSNKIILYGCTTIQEFKDKLGVYEKISRNKQNSRFSYDNSRIPNSFNYRRETGNTFHNQQRDNVQKFNAPKFNPNLENKQSRIKNETKCFNCCSFGHTSRFCPDKHRGPKCMICATFGHKSDVCPQNTKQTATISNDVNNVQKVTPLNTMCKEVQILQETILSLIDTGSQVTLMKESVWNKLNSPSLAVNGSILTGFGFSKIQIIGSFHSTISIDDQQFPVHINVVPNHTMTFDIIIGCDLIKQANLSITPEGVIFSKLPPKPSDAAQESFIFAITDDTPKFNIGHAVSKQTRTAVEDLLLSYKPVKTKTVDVKLKINLTDEIPICSSPRRLPSVEKKIVETQIEQWLHDGIIRESTSDFSSPIVLVKKKDNSYRLCVDYRRLNKKTAREHFPLPVIDDAIDRINSAKVYSTIDLRNGFFHVDVDESSRKYTSFVTHEGQYEFLKCPFGLTNSPSVFQKYIYLVFRQLLKDGIVIIYLDDIIIPSANETEGLDKLKLVLKTASEYGLELNIKKCNFLQREIEFLGYKITDGKLYPSTLKTKAVTNFPEPKCTKDVQRFLGLTGYFRKFIKNFSIIAKPLSDLLKNNVKFQFGVNEKASFNELKKLLSSEPVLSIYNPRSETEIHCDACIDGYGATLIQRSLEDNQFHPVYYMSKKTTEAERKYSSYELEIVAIIEALKKFRIYVLGIPFKIVTDCNAFTMTMNKKDLCTKIARWALMLSDFDYSIEHRKGSSMKHVDALSRYPICMIVQDTLTLKIIEAQNTDEHIQAIKEALRQNPYDDFLIKNDILYKCINGTDLLVVPEEMQMSVIKAAHEKGHYAVKRTEENLNTEFYIPKIKQKIEKCIINCIPCILTNRKRGKQEGLLNPIEKGDTPLHTYHVDHLGPLESTHKNYKHIFAVIDSFSKFVWLYPTKSTDAAEVISKLDIQKTIFGNPSRIISDKGSAFTSKEFENYCNKEGIQHNCITTALPRANGQIERLNSVIIAVLSKLSIENPSKWYLHVNNVQQVINSTFQRSINRTPFELMFGVKMKQKNDIKIIELLNAETQSSFINDREELRKEAKKQILKTQQENCKTYNLRRKKAQQFKLNDTVAIKRTQQGPGLKLKSKFFGPYKVVKVKENNTYDVEKVGFTEGPMRTSTCAEYMKPWPD